MDTSKPTQRTTEADASATVLDEFDVEASEMHTGSANGWSHRMKARTMILGALACGVVALGASTLVWSRATATETRPGSLTVESDPAGAAVSVDGKERGTTPVTVALPAGRHRLVLTHGTRSQDFSVTIAERISTVHHVTWPRDPQLGTVEVISDGAPGAVALDGIVRGTTPLTLQNVTPGDHEVIFRSDQGTQRRTIRVEPGATASLVIGTTSPAKGIQSGWLAVGTNEPLQIFENGKLVGSTESERIMLSAGEHTFTFVNSAIGFSVTRSVAVPADRVATVTVPLPRAALSVNATPWAQVWLDGESVGDTPIGNLTTTIGSHELVFRHPQLGEKRVTTLVTLKEPARVAIDMKGGQ